MKSPKNLNKNKLYDYVKKSYEYINKNKKPLFVIAVTGFTIFIGLVFLLNVYYGYKLAPFIKNLDDIETLEKRNVAIILGAGVNGDGEPSSMLEDRLDVGYQLLRQGKVSKLILSGDNREVNYNEPQAMINYLKKKGVDDSQLIPDYAGRRTYDSCYRAKEIFGQEKVFIITQEFHMVRAVFLCKSLGIDVIGITADLHNYPGLWENVTRDYIGMISAVMDAKLVKPQPVLGDKINIDSK